MAPNNRSFRRETHHVNDVELDPENPRIRLRRHADPSQCIERLAHDEGSHLVNLCRNIADNNLGVDPLVAEGRDQELVVKDGNRRIACLKMLQNPNLAPDSIQDPISRIAANATFTPEEIEFEVTEDHEAILEHMRREHAGEGRGEGTRNWKTVEIARFELDNGFRGDDEEAARILRYAEDANLAEIPPNLPITNLTRFLTQERIKAIGFEDLSPRPAQLNQPPGVVHRRLQKIIHDLYTGRINVRRSPGEGELSFMFPENQEEYLQELLAITPQDTGEEDHQTQEDDSGLSGAGLSSGEKATGQEEGLDQEGSTQFDQQTGAESGRGRHRREQPPRWQRQKVIKNVSDYGVRGLPSGKTGDIHNELKKIRVDLYPYACASLVRMFVELSIDHYIRSRNLTLRDPTISRKLRAAADDMHNQGVIEQNYRDSCKQYADRDKISVATFHGIVHDPNFAAERQVINSTWDNLLFFLRKCWEV